MTQLHILERAFKHMEWADALVWRTVLADESAAQDAYILDSLVHLHMVQRAYLAVWTGNAVEISKRDDFDGVDEIRTWARSYHAGVAGYLAQLSDARLEETIAIPWTEFIEKEIGSAPAPATLGDMILQVAAHSVHHRAQINRRIREVGGTPNLVDYIGWIWRGRPPADW